MPESIALNWQPKRFFTSKLLHQKKIWTPVRTAALLNPPEIDPGATGSPASSSSLKAPELTAFTRYTQTTWGDIGEKFEHPSSLHWLYGSSMRCKLSQYIRCASNMIKMQAKEGVFSIYGTFWQPCNYWSNRSLFTTAIQVMSHSKVKYDIQESMDFNLLSVNIGNRVTCTAGKKCLISMTNCLISEHAKCLITYGDKIWLFWLIGMDCLISRSKTHLK